MNPSSIAANNNSRTRDTRCAHRVTEPTSWVFGFLASCDVCDSRIWNVLDVVKCTGCGRTVHGTCASGNLSNSGAQDQTSGNAVASRPPSQCFARVRDRQRAAECRPANDAPDSAAPGARRAAERELRAQRAMERRDAAAAVVDRRRDDGAKNVVTVDVVTENVVTVGVTTADKTGDKTADKTGGKTAYKTDDEPSWRNRPAPEVDHFVVSKWVRRTFCDGRPAPPFTPAAPATAGRRACGPSRDRRRGPAGPRKPAAYRAWTGPQTTRLLDTGVPPTAVPAPPGPGPHWWGRQMCGPFTGPLMWHPLHEGPRSFEMPERNTEEEEPPKKPFSFDVPGYLDGTLQPALFKVTVTP